MGIQGTNPAEELVAEEGASALYARCPLLEYGGGSILDMIGQVRRLESGRVFLLIRFPPCVFFRGCFLPGERKEILSQGGVVRERRHFRREDLAVFVNAPPGVGIGHGAHLLPDSRRYTFVFLLWIP